MTNYAPRKLNPRCRWLLRLAKTSVVRAEQVAAEDKARLDYLVRLGILKKIYLGFRGDKVRYVAVY